MSATLTVPRGDAKAHALAEQFLAQAATHERAAAESSDPFEAAAHQGLAQDLRTRAQQALSQTEAAQRAAENQRRHDEALARAQALAGEDAGAYELAVRAYAAGEDEAVAALVRAAQQLHALAVAVTAARAAAQDSARNAGCQAPPDLIEPHVRALIDDPSRSAERAGLMHAAFRSPAATAARLGVIASQDADACGAWK